MHLGDDHGLRTNPCLGADRHVAVAVADDAGIQAHVVSYHNLASIGRNDGFRQDEAAFSDLDASLRGSVYVAIVSQPSRRGQRGSAVDDAPSPKRNSCCAMDDGFWVNRHFRRMHHPAVMFEAQMRLVASPIALHSPVQITKHIYLVPVMRKTVRISFLPFRSINLIRPGAWHLKSMINEGAWVSIRVLLQIGQPAGKSQFGDRSLRPRGTQVSVWVAVELRVLILWRRPA